MDFCFVLTERLDIEQEAKIIRTNVRAWLLQKNYRNVRQAMVRFQACAYFQGVLETILVFWLL